MKLVAVTLMLCAAAAAFSPGAAAYDEAKLVQQRIERLEADQDTINQESHDLGGRMTVKASISAVTGERDRISQQIDGLDAALQQLQTLREDLVGSRIQRDEKKLYTREDGREELAQNIGESIALIGLSEAAKSYTGVIGGAAFFGETLYRYSWKLENLAQLDELIATNDRNLADLRAMRQRLQIARGEEMKKLARLQELRRRDMQVFAELAEARAHLASLSRPAAAPAPKPVASTPPPPPAPRPPAERVIYPMDLAGAWTGTGYQCNGAEADEFIFITYNHEDDTLVATKSLGDECIHSTEVTWTGKLEGKVIRGRFHVRARNAPTNADSWIDGTLDVISAEEIRGFDVHFHRPKVRRR